MKMLASEYLAEVSAATPPDCADAEEAVRRLSGSNPAQAFAVLLEAINAADGIALGRIGAGLLEDLLNTHEFLLAELVEEQILKNQRFRLAFRAGEYGSVHPDVALRWGIALKDANVAAGKVPPN